MSGRTALGKGAAAAAGAPPVVVDEFLVATDDLNGYGTLFGGHLIGRVQERLLGVLSETAGAGAVHLSFSFERPARDGDRLRLHLSPAPPSPSGATAAHWAVLRGDEATATPVVTGQAVVGPARQPPERLEQRWSRVTRAWVIARDTDGEGALCLRRLANLVDAAAVIFCRECMRVGRVVTRWISDYALWSRARVDDVVEVLVRVRHQGRTSLGVDCAVVRHPSGGGTGELVLSCHMVMVATDEEGRPVHHALAQPDPRPPAFAAQPWLSAESSRVVVFAAP